MARRALRTIVVVALFAIQLNDQIDNLPGAHLGDLLDSGDVWGVARLTYLRNRSLANPHWKRDADRIRYRLTKGDPTHGPTWTTPSPLDPELAEAVAARVARFVARTRDIPVERHRHVEH